MNVEYCRSSDANTGSRFRAAHVVYSCIKLFKIFVEISVYFINIDFRLSQITELVFNTKFLKNYAPGPYHFIVSFHNHFNNQKCTKKKKERVHEKTII